MYTVMNFLLHEICHLTNHTHFFPISCS